MKIFFKQMICLAYKENHPIADVLFKSMVVFLIINLIFSLVFWYSLMTGTTINSINLNVPSDYPVKYFIDNVQNVLLISTVLAFMMMVIMFFLNRKEIKNYADKNPMFHGGPVKRIYTGEIKSFLLPKNHGYLKLWLIFTLSPILLLILTYTIISIVYYKFYNSPLYNMFADFKSQDLSTLLYWNLFTLLLYQIMICLVFIYSAFIIALIEKKILTRDLTS